MRTSQPVLVLYFLLGFCLCVAHFLRICCVHARVQVCCILLEGPPETRRFLALKIRGHIDTLCCGYDGNFHILEYWIIRFWYLSLPLCFP